MALYEPKLSYSRSMLAIVLACPRFRLVRRGFFLKKLIPPAAFPILKLHTWSRGTNAPHVSIRTRARLRGGLDLRVSCHTTAHEPVALTVESAPRI
jgi:hypothetical protein